MASILITKLFEGTSSDILVNFSADHSSSWVTSSVRRYLDCCVALLALSCSGPLFLLVAAVVRFSSPGPILFRQRRIGRDGRTFTLYKFRSMCAGTTDGCPITVSGDQRITAVGRLLRRFKLDELPQLWNVLRGDMALVGPRPKLPQHEGLKLRWRPGLTGPATLAFRDEEEILARIPKEDLEHVYDKYVKPAKARLDSEYMRTATPASDVVIIWKTIVSSLVPWMPAHTFSGEFLERSFSRSDFSSMDRVAGEPGFSKSTCLRRYARRKRAIWFAVFGLLFGIPRLDLAQKGAQALPNAPGSSRLDLFGGYSYWAPKGSLAGIPFCCTSRGNDVSGAYYFDRLHGDLGAELGLKYFPATSSAGGNQLVSGSIGPIIRFSSKFGLTPYVHVLFGAGDITGPQRSACPPASRCISAFATWGQQITVGQGFDYALPWFSHYVSLRILQADYLFDHVNYGPTQNFANASGLTAKLSSLTLTSGLVLHLGQVHPAVSLACSATPHTLLAGEPLTLTAIATHLNPRKTTTYAWQGQGLRFSLQRSVTSVDTKDLPPGQYVVTAFVKQGNRANESATCSARFTIKTVAEVPGTSPPR